MEGRKFLEQQSDRLKSVLLEAEKKLTLFSDEQWSRKPSPEKWSRKEILGHLIDSAANNHLRFVRAQLCKGEFYTHKYEQNFFVQSQNYQNRDSKSVFSLWYFYNLHLADLIRNIDPEKLNVILHIGDYAPQTLSFVVEDYITHLNHHLKQIYEA